MMITLSTGRTIKLAFVHSSHDFQTREDAGALRQAIDDDARVLRRRVTLCEILQVNFGVTPASSDSILGHGVAVCHPNDVFTKKGGRKHSLGKALFAAGLNYPERAEVWSAYNAAFGV